MELRKAAVMTLPNASGFREVAADGIPFPAIMMEITLNAVRQSFSTLSANCGHRMSLYVLGLTSTLTAIFNGHKQNQIDDLLLWN